MAWRIDGKLFDMRGIGLTVRRGAREIWEIANPPAHAAPDAHTRLSLPRAGAQRQPGAGEAARGHGTRTGGLRSRWKDTVLIWPGETARIALDFSHPYLGDQVYMFHCHNLQHADRGMMVNVKVAA